MNHARVGSLASVAHEMAKHDTGPYAPLTPFVAYCLGHGFARLIIMANSSLSNHQEQSSSARPIIRIALGQDPRPHGQRLADAFSRGAQDASHKHEVQVYYAGIATTPACAAFCRNQHMDASVMVTASHLPVERNGFKLFQRDGACLSKQDITVLGNYASQCAVEWYTRGMLPPTSGDGAVLCRQWVDEFMPAYARDLQKAIQRQVYDGSTNDDDDDDDNQKCLEGLTIVVNAGHGSGGFFHQVLADLGANVQGSLGIEPDGSFPLGIPNPEYKPMMEATTEACARVQADLGIMLDTDSDRCGFIVPVTSSTNDDDSIHYEPLNRNRLIALMGVILAESYPGAGVVTDSVTSEGLSDFLEGTLGLQHVRYLKGYQNVIDKAKELTEAGVMNAELAMETSGHGAMRENHYMDDGTYTAVKVVSLLAREKLVKGNDAGLLTLISKMRELDVIEELRFTTKDASLESMHRVFDYCALEIERMCEAESSDGPEQTWSIDTDNLEGIRVRVGDGQFFMLRKSLHDPVISLQLEATNMENAKGLIAAPLLKLFRSEEQIQGHLDLSALETLLGVQDDDDDDGDDLQKATVPAVFMVPIEVSDMEQQSPSTESDVSWFPLVALDSISDSTLAQEEHRQDVEDRSVALASQIIQNRLQQVQQSKSKDIINADGDASDGWPTIQNERIHNLVHNRFMDLACTPEGEASLESLFADPILTEENIDDMVIRGAVMILQSLCVYGTQVGVKGSPEQLRRMVAHLDYRRNPDLIRRDLLEHWDSDSVRRLKYQLEKTPATQVLAKLIWKRSPQGAFDLMVAMQAWEPHEDVALLRSGFPLRFSQPELDAASVRIAAYHEKDPETLLGIRKDLRKLKVFTIDGPSTLEIDDGLSVQKLVSVNETGEEELRYRIWVHIADAERLAEKGSDLYDIARKRITSLYLPRGSISMFPPSVCTDLMSLRDNEDSYALSMAMEINADGSIDEKSIHMIPSLIRVDYRLTYDEVDEMLQEGIGYAEEWELGVLLDTALARRQYRIQNGSSEGLIPNPIPYSSVSTVDDENAPDGIDITVKVEVSHNAGRNQTAESVSSSMMNNRVMENAEYSSSSFLLVTEAMIAAGEALGRWQHVMETTLNQSKQLIPNHLRLPFRTQPKPDYGSRARERSVMNDLMEYNVGDGLCYAWYSRRFLQPVRVTEERKPHSGLGLDCYVQWSSPIRRFTDLQVHASIKRFLRRKRVNDMIQHGLPIPKGLTSRHLGMSSRDWEALLDKKDIGSLDVGDLDKDVNYLEGIGLFGAARTLQRQSQQYWLYEYINRKFTNDPDVTFEAVVLGCTDPEKQQHAIYVYELGLEHRYIDVGKRLDPGTKLRLKIQNVVPRHGLLSFVRVVS